MSNGDRRQGRADALALDIHHLLAAHATTPVRPETLAQALQVPLAALNGCLQTLEEALAAAGQRLHRSPDGLQLVPDPAEQPGQLADLLRAQHGRAGLSPQEASVLARAVAGTLELARLSNADQVAFGRLRNADLVTDDGRPTADVEFSLDGAAGRA